jgi:hypothetical protein
MAWAGRSDAHPCGLAGRELQPAGRLHAGVHVLAQREAVDDVVNLGREEHRDGIHRDGQAVPPGRGLGGGSARQSQDGKNRAWRTAPRYRRRRFLSAFVFVDPVSSTKFSTIVPAGM